MAEEFFETKPSETTLNMEGGNLEIISKDSQEDLLSNYNNFKNVAAGKIISDVSLVSEKLIDWMPLAQAEEIIPFTFKRMPHEIMNRIWMLSRQKGTRFYSGQWFDLRVSETKKRQRIKSCRLSSTAIEVFNNNPNIRENK